MHRSGTKHGNTLDAMAERPAELLDQLAVHHERSMNIEEKLTANRQLRRSRPPTSASLSLGHMAR
jgi:hypothetical protein